MGATLRRRMWWSGSSLLLAHVSVRHGSLTRAQVDSDGIDTTAEVTGVRAISPGRRCQLSDGGAAAEPARRCASTRCRTTPAGPEEVITLRIRDDLSVAYTPRVGRVSQALQQNPADVRRLMVRGNAGRGGH